MCKQYIVGGIPFMNVFPNMHRWSLSIHNVIKMSLSNIKVSFNIEKYIKLK